MRQSNQSSHIDSILKATGMYDRSWIMSTRKFDGGKTRLCFRIAETFVVTKSSQAAVAIERKRRGQEFYDRQIIQNCRFELNEQARLPREGSTPSDLPN